MLSVAFAARLEGGRCADARLVIGALGAKPRLIGGVAELSRGRALDGELGEALAAAAAKQCHPLINVAYDRDYRHAMVPVFVKRAVRDAAGG
jgi:CO/xanthine dehydrogenase FAD-binding subunit